MQRHRRTPSSNYEPVPANAIHQPGWVAMPDENEDELMNVESQARSWSATMWWLFVSASVLAVLTYGEAPWWLITIVAAEVYASLRRWLLGLRSVTSTAAFASPGTPTRERRLRHFTSVRLSEGAPIDEIVARFLTLDSLSSVRTVELGTVMSSSPSSTEQQSRGHSLGMLVSFAGTAERRAFLSSAERAEFLSFLEPFVSDRFVFDFESGAVN